MAPSISYIIPAFNEQAHIGNTLDALRSGNQLNVVDTIVVDNQSTDATAQIARAHGATVLTIAGGPVSKLRNIGVAASRGDILVFIDADVSVTEEWHRFVPEAIARLAADPGRVTGSHCLPPPGSENFLERYWFSSFERSSSSHLGTGHLIMTRSMFELVGGFSEELETGEDYDICMKVKRCGGTINEDATLKVVHNDFPKTLRQFVRRECWHGMGDAGTWSVALKSKVAIASLIFIALNVCLIASSVTMSILAAIVSACSLGTFLGLVSYVKFHRFGPKVVFFNAATYYFYFLGRSIALFNGLLLGRRVSV